MSPGLLLIDGGLGTLGGGVFVDTSGTDCCCEPVPQMGACCVGETCIPNVTQLQCSAQGGIFLPGVPCSPFNPCQLPACDACQQQGIGCFTVCGCSEQFTVTLSPNVTVRLLCTPEGGGAEQEIAQFTTAPFDVFSFEAGGSCLYLGSSIVFCDLSFLCNPNPMPGSQRRIFGYIAAQFSCMGVGPVPPFLRWDLRIQTGWNIRNAASSACNSLNLLESTCYREARYEHEFNGPITCLPFGTYFLDPLNPIVTTQCVLPCSDLPSASLFRCAFTGVVNSVTLSP